MVVYILYEYVPTWVLTCSAITNPAGPEATSASRTRPTRQALPRSLGARARRFPGVCLYMCIVGVLWLVSTWPFGWTGGWIAYLYDNI